MIRAKLTAIAMAMAITAPLFATTLVHVAVPTSDTRLYVNDQLMPAAGTQREFVRDSSGLDPTKLYHYDFRAAIDVDGHIYDKTVSVSFYLDNDISVRFALRRGSNDWFLNGEATVAQGSGQAVPEAPPAIPAPAAPPTPTPVAPPTSPPPTETPVVLPSAPPAATPASGAVPGYPNPPSYYYGYPYGYPYYNAYTYPYYYGGYPY